MYKKTITVSVMCFLSVIFYGQETFQIEAKIGVEKKDNLVKITGIAMNKSSIHIEELDYLLLSLKKGNTGNYSKNKQSGTFCLKPNEVLDLAILQESVQQGEFLKVYLFIKNEGKLITKDSVMINLIDKKKLEQSLDETSIEIKGLVIDEVKTKIGKDFYDYFHQSYQSLNKKFPFYIFIYEKPTMGRGSIISIKVDDKILYEFRSNSKEEYLRSAARITLSRIVNYSRKRKMLFKQNRI